MLDEEEKLEILLANSNQRIREREEERKNQKLQAKAALFANKKKTPPAKKRTSQKQKQQSIQDCLKRRKKPQKDWSDFQFPNSSSDDEEEHVQKKITNDNEKETNEKENVENNHVTDVVEGQEVSAVQQQPQEKKSLSELIAIPNTLSEVEGTAVRNLVAIFDPDVLGAISHEKLTAIARYLKNLIQICDTPSKREELLAEIEDEDQRAERTGQNIEYSDEDDDEDDEDEGDEEDEDFVVSDSEAAIVYEEGYDPQTALTRRLKRKVVNADEKTEENEHSSSDTSQKRKINKKIIEEQEEEEVISETVLPD